MDDKWKIALYGMFRKPAHEAWILHGQNVRAHSLRSEYDIIQYSKLEWRFNSQYSTQSAITKIQVAERWQKGLYVPANGSTKMSFGTY